MGAFQVNQAARDGMVEALLTTFDGRFWIPISNILLRLVKGSGFGQHSAAARSGKAGAEECSSEVFQRLLCVTCESNPKLFSAFLNRIFNTLNWTITEFSVAMKVSGLNFFALRTFLRRRISKFAKRTVGIKAENCQENGKKG